MFDKLLCMLPKLRSNVFHYVLLVSVSLIFACSSDPPDGATDACVWQVSHEPGVYREPISLKLFSNSAENVEYSISTSSVSERGRELLSRRVAVSAPVDRQPYLGNITLFDGSYRVTLYDFCDGQWYAYEYLIDTTTPDVQLMPPGGTFADPITVWALSNEPTADVLIRYYRSGSAPTAFLPVSEPILFDRPGQWIGEAIAIDIAGNRSKVTAETYLLETNNGFIEQLDLKTSKSNASLLPRIDVSFSRPMSTTITVLPGAVQFPNGSTSAKDLNLLWMSEKDVIAWPARRLPESTDVQVTFADLPTFDGGKLFFNEISTSVLLRTCTACLNEFSIKSVTASNYHLTAATTTPIRLIATVSPPPLEKPTIFLTLENSDNQVAFFGPDHSSWDYAPKENDNWSRIMVTADASFFSPGDLTSVRILKNGPDIPTGVVLSRSTTGSTPSTSPTLLSTTPRSGETAAVDDLLLQFSLPLNIDQLQASVTVTVNGITVPPSDLLVEALPPPTYAVFRVASRSGFQPGDEVVVNLGSSVDDLWGRMLPTPYSVSFTIASSPNSSASVLWSAPSEHKNLFAKNMNLVAGVISPPITEVSNLKVIDQETGHAIDAFRVHFSPPRRGLRSSEAWSYFRIDPHSWMPPLPNDRWYEISFKLGRAIDSLQPGGEIVRAVYATATSPTPRAAAAFPVGQASLNRLGNGDLQVEANVELNEGISAPSLDLTSMPNLGPFSLGGAGTAPHRKYELGPSNISNSSVLGEVQIIISGNGFEIKRPVFAHSDDEVPSGKFPAPGTVVNASEEAVGFSWAITDSARLETLWLVLKKEPDGQLRYFVLPANARESWIPMDYLPDAPYAYPTTFSWTIIGVNTRGPKYFLRDDFGGIVGKTFQSPATFEIHPP